MYAVFEHKDKQYKAFKGDVLKLPRSNDLKKNDILNFNNDVLIKNEDGQTIIGTPLVKGAQVRGKVIEQIRDKKIIVFKKKRRQNYRRKIGHRQDLTLVKIEEITTSTVSKKLDVDKTSKVIKKENSDGT